MISIIRINKIFSVKKMDNLQIDVSDVCLVLSILYIPRSRLSQQLSI